LHEKSNRSQKKQQFGSTKKGALFTGKAHFGLALDKYAPVLGGRCHLLKQLQSTHAN
jgi:hypothetical protein